MNPLVIRPVLTRRDERAFIKFQWVPYRGNPYWVPPLLMDRRKLIDRRKNPFYHHAELGLWLAERDGRIVGRIGAIVNHNHNGEHNEKTGFFGFFECLDDQETATALFEAACRWLKEKGMEAVRGPASPSVNDEYGLLVEGFDHPPVIMMPYNPPSYARLIEGAGFVRIKDLYAYDLDSRTVFSDKLIRGAEIVRKRTGVTIRQIDMGDFENEVKRIRELYVRGWSRNWGEVPMTEEEFDSLSKDLKMAIEPRIALIAEIKGKPVGFGLTLPDYNQILIKNRRGYLLPALLRVLLFRKRIHYARVMVLGVLPEYQATGIGGVLFYETGRRSVEAGYTRGEAGWVLEDNLLMTRGAEMMNGKLWKRYRIYQKSLAG
jgi:GNAT superfamily N-acetyltransferase